ncbi:hypothetical protein ElyMa_003996000 [Elysia marginata]|uniref:Transmembrane protein 50A n=1 Tax=Elysia marginata TaxID=1093978 RepID=A0AAV4G1U0_9GAST|nr:hypothetical protein ElyMa_003996000 [Elysia marginata]
MSCAVATSLLSLLIGLFSLCCYCRSCNAHQAAGAFINLTFLLVAVAMCLFGAKSHMDFDVEVEADDDSQVVTIFGWSFWVGVGAGGMALISSILYIWSENLSATSDLVRRWLNSSRILLESLRWKSVSQFNFS